MQNITLKLKDLTDPTKIEIVTYKNAIEGYPVEGFFYINIKEKGQTGIQKNSDNHYYPTHLILKVECEYTQHCFDPIVIEKASFSIDKL